jgi:hypothetical protein
MHCTPLASHPRTGAYAAVVPVVVLPPGGGDADPGAAKLEDQPKSAKALKLDADINGKPEHSRI